MDNIKVAKVDDVRYRRAGVTTTGTLHLTAHHLIFHNNEADEEELWTPYPLISLVMRLPHSLDGYAPIAFHCRNFRSFSLFFKRESDTIDVFESVRGLTVALSITHLYAFFYTPNPPFLKSDGWSLYSPREEFARMGVGSRTKAWRFSDINKDYTFCPTYPSRLVIPTRISDTTLQYASRYRSKCRIPTLAYLHWANYGTITRSSQPMVGITLNRSIQDEKLIEAIFESHHYTDSRVPYVQVYGATATNLIIDARPTTNAVANVAKGAGTENMDYYKTGKKAYLGVDNIHVMRESLNKVVDALREADALAANVGPDEVARLAALGTSFLDRQALRRSGWLRHVSAILEGAVLIVKNVHINSSHVLIHCSDGWDRTAQLSSLAQICLDPYYRTIRGFQILVEKDWLSFGHRFLDRCGHLSSEKFFLSSADTPGGARGAEVAQAFLASVQNRIAGQSHLKEISPVFHQFLECVRQIQRQFPERFEFNSRFLEQLHYHLYTCQFGTFLFNNERERRVGDSSDPGPLCERTVSVWDLFNSTEEIEKNRNPAYDSSLDDPTRRTPPMDMGVLLPNPKDVRFWHELYGRTDEEMNGKVVVSEAVGTEVVGPMGADEDDPVTKAAAGLATILLSSSPSPSPSPTPTVAAAPTVQRDASWTSLPGSSTLSSSMPELKPAHAHNRAESFRPFISTTSAFTMRSNSLNAGPSTDPYATPSRLRPRQSGDLFSSPGVKSMWGKLSTNASAAFTAVQGAYDGVTKGFSTSLGGDAERDTGGELRSRGAESSFRDDADWTSASMNTRELRTTSGSAPERSRERWRTESTASGPGGLTLDNPWGTSTSTSRASGRSSPRRVDEIFATQSVWSEQRSTRTPSPLTRDPTVASVAGMSAPVTPAPMVSRLVSSGGSPSQTKADAIGLLPGTLPSLHRANTTAFSPTPSTPSRQDANIDPLGAGTL